MGVALVFSINYRCIYINVAVIRTSVPLILC